MKILTILKRTQISPVSPKGVRNRAGGALHLEPGKHKVICLHEHSSWPRPTPNYQQMQHSRDK